MKRLDENISNNKEDEFTVLILNNTSFVNQ